MSWLQQFREATPQTKWFILNWFFYGFLIVAICAYCYARLDFVRSGPNNETSQVMEQK